MPHVTRMSGSREVKMMNQNKRNGGNKNTKKDDGQTPEIPELLLLYSSSTSPAFARFRLFQIPGKNIILSPKKKNN